MPRERETPQERAPRARTPADIRAAILEGLSAESSDPEKWPDAPNHARVLARWTDREGTEIDYHLCTVGELRALLAVDAAQAQPEREPTRLNDPEGFFYDSEGGF
jgi:hypothetical protein